MIYRYTGTHPIVAIVSSVLQILDGLFCIFSLGFYYSNFEYTFIDWRIKKHQESIS